MCLSDSRFLRLLRKCWFERIRRPHFTKCWKRATSASDSRWRITGRGATNSVDKGSKHSIRRFISRLGWESLARPARCNKRRPDSGGCGTIWGDGEREGGREGGRGTIEGTVRAGVAFERETNLRFALSPRRLSLRLRAFVPPAFSFLLHLSASPSPQMCAFVYAFPSARISVWSGSRGFVVMTTNPGNPATLSHPLWLSRDSLSIRSSLSRFLFPPYTHTHTHISVYMYLILSSIRTSVILSLSDLFAETFFLASLVSFSFVSLSLSLHSAATPIPACGFYASYTSTACTPRTYVYDSTDSAARFIHLLGSVPGAARPPSLVYEGGGPSSTLSAIPVPAQEFRKRERELDSTISGKLRIQSSEMKMCHLATSFIPS